MVHPKKKRKFFQVRRMGCAAAAPGGPEYSDCYIIVCAFFLRTASCVNSGWVCERGSGLTSLMAHVAQ